MARVIGPSRVTDKWAWDCGQCGDWSGYRYGSEATATDGAERHNVEATERDRQAHQRLYGPKRVQ